MALALTVLTSQNITRVQGSQAVASTGSLGLIIFVPDPFGSRYRIKVMRLNNAASIAKDAVVLARFTGTNAASISPGQTFTTFSTVQNVWESSMPAGPSQDQTNLGDEFRVLPGEILGVLWFATGAGATNDANLGYVFELTLYHAV